MKQDEQAALERQEIYDLLDKGVEFDVTDTELRPVGPRRWWWPFRRREAVPVCRQYSVKGLTLGTLDRLSAEWIEMADFEARHELPAEADETERVAAARGVVREHARRAARVVAIATLGNEWQRVRNRHGHAVFTENTKEIERRTELFLRALTPATLYKIAIMIVAMGDLGDFVSSIRLMQMGRTTIPRRVENEG